MTAPAGYRSIMSAIWRESDLFVCDDGDEGGCLSVVVEPERHSRVCPARWPWPGAPSPVDAPEVPAGAPIEALASDEVERVGEREEPAGEAGGDGDGDSSAEPSPEPAEAPRITPESPAPPAEEGLAAAELVARIKELAPQAIQQPGARESWLRTLLRRHDVEVLEEMDRLDLWNTANELRASIERRRRESRAS